MNYGEDIYSVYFWRTMAVILMSLIPILSSVIGWLWFKVDKIINKNKEMLETNKEILEEILKRAELCEKLQELSDMFDLFEEKLMKYGDNELTEDLGRIYDKIAVIKDKLDALFSNEDKK